MSRWIDADELITRIRATISINTDVIGTENDTLKKGLMLCEKLIERKCPSIDIVQCKECKYASDDGTYGCMCEHFNDASDAYHRMWSDDFCSCGERKE